MRVTSRVGVRPQRIRVFKHFDRWHFWCPCCVGGDWYDDVWQAWLAAEHHARFRHNHARHWLRIPT